MNVFENLQPVKQQILRKEEKYTYKMGENSF